MFDPDATVEFEYNVLKALTNSQATQVINLLYRGAETDGYDVESDRQWRQEALKWLGEVFPRARLNWLLTTNEMIHLGLKHRRLEIRLARFIASLIFPDGVAHPRERELWESPDQPPPWRDELVRSADPWSPGEVKTKAHSFKPLNDDERFWVGRHRPWLTGNMRPDQIEASDYQREVARLQRTRAGRRAKRLLMDHLSRDQRRDYFTKGVFIVPGSIAEGTRVPRTLYVLDNSYPNGNIFEIRKNEPIANICFHPSEPYPMDDILLTQMLAISTEEEEFRKVGNRVAREGDEFPMPSINGYSPQLPA